MKTKRIPRDGFMGSMPIAGVIWQHMHYIVGLQRLGTTFTTRGFGGLPYNPETFEVNDEFDYAARLFRSIGAGIEFGNRWAFLRAVILTATRRLVSPLKKNRQLYREAGRGS